VAVDDDDDEDLLLGHRLGLSGAGLSGFLLLLDGGRLLLHWR